MTWKHWSHTFVNCTDPYWSGLMVPLPIAGVFGSFAYNVTMTIRAAGLVRPLILHRPRNCMCRCYSCSQLWIFFSHDFQDKSQSI
jgi:hypothetical protein